MPDPKDSLIRANVLRLRAKKATDEQVAEYLRDAEGVDPAQFLKAPERKGGWLAPLAQGMTFSFADEALGAVEGMNRKLHGGSFREGYDEGAAKIRGIGGDYAKDHPVASTALEMAGGIATGGGSLMSGARAVRGVATGARGAGLRLVRSGLNNAAQGALAGAGASQGGPEQRAMGAVAGGVAGGVLGVALPAVGKVVGGAAKVGASIANPSGKMARSLARNALVDAVERGGTPVESLAMANQTKTPRAILDMGGRHTLSLARAAVNIPSKATEEIPNYLTKRHGGQQTRITRALEETLGLKTEDADLLGEHLIAKRKDAAMPLYEAAYAHGVVDIPEVNETLKLKAFRVAYRRAQRIAATEGIPLPDISKGQPPTVQALDYVKRGLDDVIEGGMRKGSIGKTEARALRNRLSGMLAHVDNAVPDYKAARAQFAGDSEVLNALEQGREIFKMKPAQVRRFMSDATESEREMFKKGALDHLYQEMNKAGDGADLTARIAGSDEKRELVQALFGDDGKNANKLREWIKSETGLMHANRAVGGNSTTTAQMMAIADLMGVNAGEVATALGSGNVIGAGTKIFQSLVNNRLKGVGGNVASELSPMLKAQPGTQEYKQVVADLIATAKKRRLSQSARRTTSGSVAQESGRIVGGSGNN